MELYLSIPSAETYEKHYALLSELNSGNQKPVKGVYITEDQLTDNLESVFGTNGNRSILLGSRIFCETFANVKKAQKYRKLDFITCNSEYNDKPSPYSPIKQAENVISRCLSFKESAVEYGIMAEISCLVDFSIYNASGINTKINFAFREFWCKILNEVARDKLLPKMIMVEPIEFGPFFEIAGTWELPKAAKGWWRRTHPYSYEEGAFIERVDELPKDHSSVKCTPTCEVCKTSSDCCLGTCEEDSLMNSTFVCRFNITICESRSSIVRAQNLQMTTRKKLDLKRSVETAVTSYTSSASLHIALISVVTGSCIFLILIVIYFHVSLTEKS